MSAMHFRHALALVLAVASLPANAKTEVPPAVSFVATAGSWDGAAAHGVYRVVVWNEGFEHVSSGVVAEWITEPGDANEAAAIATSASLVTPGQFSLDAPRLDRVGDKVRVTLHGVRTYESTRRVSCVFDLMPDMTVVVVRACG